MIRYGVVGTGMMGMEHLANLRHLDGATVTAIADPDPSSRDTAHRFVPDAAVFTDHRDLAASGLCDAVVVATPNHTHAAVLADLLPTNLHVMVEKPLATTVADARHIVDLARDREAITWVGLEYRYMPPIARLIREAHAGTAGRLRMVAIREHRFPFLPKVGHWNRFSENTGGTLVEKCCHFFDLMVHILDDRPVRVYASGAQDVNHLDESYDGRRPDILDNAYVVLDFSGGARAMLDLCMFAEATFNQEEISVVGDEGKIEALIPENVVRIGRRGTHAIGEAEVHHVSDPRIAYVGHHHGASYLEHLDFLEAIRTGSAPRVSVEDGLLSVAIGVAAHESITETRPVALTEVM